MIFRGATVKSSKPYSAQCCSEEAQTWTTHTRFNQTFLLRSSALLDCIYVPWRFLCYFLRVYAIFLAYSDYEVNLILVIQVFLMMSCTCVGFVAEMIGVPGLGSRVNWSSPPSTTHEHNNCAAFFTFLSLSGSFLKIQISLKFLLVNGKQYLELAR
jgi:hypothetical protein